MLGTQNPEWFWWFWRPGRLVRWIVGNPSSASLLHSTIGFIHIHITAGHKVSLGSCNQSYDYVHSEKKEKKRERRASSNSQLPQGGSGVPSFPNYHVNETQRFVASCCIQVAIVNFAERERPWAQFTMTWSFSKNELSDFARIVVTLLKGSESEEKKNKHPLKTLWTC